MAEMFGYEMEVDSHTETSREPESNDEWDRGDTDTFHSFVKISKRSEFPEIASSLDIPVGSDCFVVWASYSTGDSFGHDQGGGKILLGVFLDEKPAQELETEIEKRDQARDQAYELNFTTSDGQVFKIYQPWVGYFESLDYIRIEGTVMK
jgi:hypothetical protein